MEDSDRIVIFEINDLDHDRWDLEDSGDEFLNMVEIAPGLTHFPILLLSLKMVFIFL